MVKHLGVRYPCSQCDYVATQMSHLNRHVQSKHELIKYPCSQCGYEAAELSSLRRHQKSQHEGVRYPCDQCGYTTSRISHLKNHKAAKHDNVKYFCDQCEYSAPELSSLKRHQKSKHEGIRFPCEHCDYAAARMAHLKAHKAAKHKDVRYQCNLCDYEATETDLRLHKEISHPRNPLGINLQEDGKSNENFDKIIKRAHKTVETAEGQNEATSSHNELTLQSGKIEDKPTLSLQLEKNKLANEINITDTRPHNYNDQLIYPFPVSHNHNDIVQSERSLNMYEAVKEEHSRNPYSSRLCLPVNERTESPTEQPTGPGSLSQFTSNNNIRQPRNLYNMSRMGLLHHNRLEETLTISNHERNGLNYL